jgi:hypothetical protein
VDETQCNDLNAVEDIIPQQLPSLVQLGPQERRARGMTEPHS